MLVEFVGPPGSGKSTLARDMVALMPEARVEDVQGWRDAQGMSLTPRQVRSTRVASLFHNPRLTAVAGRAMFSDRALISPMLNICRRDRAMRRVADDGWVMVDEGPLHGLATILSQVQVPNGRILQRLVVQPHIVVRVRVAAAVAVMRARQRDPDHRLARQRVPDAMRAVERYDAELDALLEGRPIIDIRNDELSQTTARRVVAALSRGRAASQ